MTAIFIAFIGMFIFNGCSNKFKLYNNIILINIFLNIFSIFFNTFNTSKYFMSIYFIYSDIFFLSCKAVSKVKLSI